MIVDIEYANAYLYYYVSVHAIYQIDLTKTQTHVHTYPTFWQHKAVGI